MIYSEKSFKRAIRYSCDMRLPRELRVRWFSVARKLHRARPVELVAALESKMMEAS